MRSPNSRCRQRTWLLFLSASWLLVCLTSAAAQTGKQPSALYDSSHSAWTARDGAPTNITSLAQTSDGYLWIGTPLGLHRFDGLKFSNFPLTAADPKLPGREISALAADQQDGLWIGFSHGGLAYLARRSMAVVVLPGRYEHVAISGLYCCSRGSLWVIAGDTILRWNGQSWENIGSMYGLPPGTYFTLFFDRDGNIWTAARHRVYTLKAGARRFVEVAQAFSVTQFVQSRDGAIWISDGWTSIRPLFHDCPAATVKLQGTAAVAIDDKGRIWFAEDTSGVGRISRADRACEKALEVETFNHRDGLSGDVTRSLLIDHDGNIWVGTEQGLDRFRPRSFLPVLDGEFKYYPALATASDGSVWANAHGMRLQHITARGIASLGKKMGSSPIAIDREDRVWLLDPWDHRLHCLDPRTGMDRAIAMPEQFKDTVAQQIVVRRDGSILLNLEGNGLWSFNGSWRQERFVNLPPDAPTSVNKSADGSKLWVGYDNNRLFQINEGSTRASSISLGLEVGTVLNVSQTAGTLWVAGTEGVDFAKDDRFHPLKLRDAAITQGTSGDVYDNDGNLWLNTGAGVVRIAASDVQHVLGDPQYSAPFSLYGDADGIQGTPAQAKPVPTLVKSGDGQIWVATAGHIFRTVPSIFDKARVPPMLTIDAVKVDGTAVPFGAMPLQLQVGRDNRIEFDYAGIDLASAAQVAYRYKLEGYDSNWQNVDRGREAVYANLGPGTYRFRVEATADSEHWAGIEDALVFAVRPAFYQRTWFLVLCLLPIGLLLWFFYWMRMRYVTSRIKDRLEQRANERLRIARELHDTLLQSIHGLMLRFHYAAEQLDDSHPVRPALRVALQRADDLILEGRNRVQDLRGEVDRNQSLSDLIKQNIVELQAENSPCIHVIEEGVRRPMHSLVKEDLCRICRECVVNALAHSKATSIEVELNYGAAFFDLRCRDNGRGIDPVVLREGGKSGHWGLRGMKERARNIGANFRMWSTPGRGTEIELRLKAVAAYDDAFTLAGLFKNRAK